VIVLDTSFLVAFHNSRDDAAIIIAARHYDARHIATFDRKFADLKGITVVR
jgi:predicted nucleic acid-binding protein